MNDESKVKNVNFSVFCDERVYSSDHGFADINLLKKRK